jgi:AcrR family transcriptional regulator
VKSDVSEPSPPSDDTRKRIIEEARAQLRRFGQDKLTVVDIARALGMSHANVYRFFKTKAEILDAVIDDWLARVEALVEGIAEQPGTAAERLEAIVLEIHRKRRRKLQTDAEVYESFRRMIEKRPDAVAKRQEKIFNVFKKLIELGIRCDEFTKVDADVAARTLEDATAIFLHPLIMPATLNERTEDRARNVVRAVLASISPGLAA